MLNRNDKIVVWINKAVLSELVLMANKFYPYETGGVLIGYWGDDTAVVVTQCVGPGPNAVHKLDSFSPDHDYQVGEIERIYLGSNRTETYLGDWHIHPNAGPYLSDTDKKTLKRIASHRAARLKVPLMVVLGTKPAEIKAWSHKVKSVLKYSSIEECYIRLFLTKISFIFPKELVNVHEQ